MIFRNTYKQEFTIEQMVDTIKDILRKKTKYDEYEIIIGSDSQRYGRNTIYISAVVLYHISHGGKVFYTKNILPHRNSIDLSVRIMQETQYTVQILQEMETSGTVDMIGKDNVSAHVDVSREKKYLSNKMINSVMGWVKGIGFNCVCKPDSWCSSHVADRFTKRKKKFRKKIQYEK